MASSLRTELKLNRPFGSVEQEAFLNLVRTTGDLVLDVARLLKNARLSMPQYNVLRILRGAGETGLTCREVGARMVSAVPDVTRLLDRLEARGLVSRTRETQDRRVVTSRATAKGLEVLKRLDEPMLAEHARQLGPLGTEKLRTLIAALEEIRSFSGRDMQQDGTKDVPEKRGR